MVHGSFRHGVLVAPLLPFSFRLHTPYTQNGMYYTTAASDYGESQARFGR